MFFIADSDSRKIAGTAALKTLTTKLTIKSPPEFFPGAILAAKKFFA